MAIRVFLSKFSIEIQLRMDNDLFLEIHWKPVNRVINMKIGIKLLIQ